MATGGRRDEIDARLAGWEAELETLRLRLAGGPEEQHAKHASTFAALYRRKELVRSRWEAIRGIYGPDPAAVRAFEAALADMAAAREAAAPLVAEILGSAPQPAA